MTEQMKPSGIEWIGDIPKSWKVTRLQTLFDQVKDKNSGTKEKNLLSLSYGKIVKKDIEGAFGLIPESFDTYNIIKKNDIVLRLTDMQNDQVSLRTGLVKEEKGIITSAYVTIRLKCGSPSYYHWYLYAFDTSKQIYAFGQGVRQSLTFEELKKMLILLPSPKEQHVIADFLDKECAQIDSIAADLEKQIALLQQYKKSLITETVTKGLDKSVPMKDSGVEWIEEIPEHWRLKRLKYIAKLKTGTTPPGNEGINYDENGINWFTPSDFLPNMQLDTSEKYIDRETIRYENIQTYPRGSVLLVAIGATVGKTGISKNNAYSNQQITAVIPQHISGNYLLYYLASKSPYIKDNALYTTLPIINNSYLQNITIVVPPTTEQEKIVEFLNRKSSIIDELIEDKNKLLLRLQQHKKSLIYEYVTGKKRVKEVQ